MESTIAWQGGNLHEPLNVLAERAKCPGLSFGFIDTLNQKSVVDHEIPRCAGALNVSQLAF